MSARPIPAASFLRMRPSRPRGQDLGQEDRAAGELRGHRGGYGPRRQSLGVLVMLTFTAVMDACVCLGENDVFASTVHGRSGGLPECIGCMFNDTATTE